MSAISSSPSPSVDLVEPAEEGSAGTGSVTGTTDNLRDFDFDVVMVRIFDDALDRKDFRLLVEEGGFVGPELLDDVRRTSGDD